MLSWGREVSVFFKLSFHLAPQCYSYELIQNQGRVVRKRPINANPRLDFNRGFQLAL